MFLLMIVHVEASEEPREEEEEPAGDDLSDPPPPPADEARFKRGTLVGGGAEAEVEEALPLLPPLADPSPDEDARELASLTSCSVRREATPKRKT